MAKFRAGAQFRAARWAGNSRCRHVSITDPGRTPQSLRIGGEPARSAAIDALLARRVLRGVFHIVVGVTAVADRRPDERRPDGGDDVATVDDEPGDGHRGVDATQQ